MKISYNWLQEYFVEKLPTSEKLADILTMLGLEVEKTITKNLSGDYLSQFIVAEVKTVDKHPNADKLRIAKVDTKSAILNIVCGAPNLFVGQKVALAPINSILKIDAKEIKIKKSKIRGEISEGMLCSEAEIGISDNHSEIISLPENVSIGDSLSRYYDSDLSDTIFEVAITPNRGDALSYIGLAVDLGAKLGINIKYPQIDSLKGVNKITTNDFVPKVNIWEANLCSRYMAIKIKDINVSQSPKDIKDKLLKSGINSVNNIVDIANIVMLETGQPIHSFDLGFIVGQDLNIRLANNDEKILTLDNKEKCLDNDVLIIADSKKPLCIAGLIGGKDSAIKDTTKDILIEIAHFNPEAIRKSTKKYNLVTDSAFRFERHVDPNLVDVALGRILYLLKTSNIINKDKQIDVFDYYPNKVLKEKIAINFAYITDTIGINIPKKEIIAILKRLNFNILEQTETELLLEIPTIKSDIKTQIDVVEEILRIYGYDNVELPKKISFSTKKNYKSEFIEKIQTTISNFLTYRGYYEVINNSLTKSVDLINTFSAKEIIKISNPLSQDLNILRYSLLPSILDNISYNKRRQKHDIKIFEIGNIYNHNILYDQSLRLAIAVTGVKQKEYWNDELLNTSFFSLKGIIDSLFIKLGISNYITVSRKSFFSSNALAYSNSNNKTFVELGEVNKDILKHFSIKANTFYAEINLSEIIDMACSRIQKEPAFSNYPSIRRDLSLLLGEDVQYSTLVKEAQLASGKILKDINIFDVYIGDKIPTGCKSYSISFVFQSKDKTLSDKEIDAVMQNIIQHYKAINVVVRAN